MACCNFPKKELYSNKNYLSNSTKRRENPTPSTELKKSHRNNPATSLQQVRKKATNPYPNRAKITTISK